MGMISNAVNSALESFGSAMMDAGEWGMESGYKVWTGCGKIAIQYAQTDPESLTNA